MGMLSAWSSASKKSRIYASTSAFAIIAVMAQSRRARRLALQLAPPAVCIGALAYYYTHSDTVQTQTLQKLFGIFFPDESSTPSRAMLPTPRYPFSVNDYLSSVFSPNTITDSFYVWCMSFVPASTVKSDLPLAFAFWLAKQTRSKSRLDSKLGDEPRRFTLPPPPPGFTLSSKAQAKLNIDAPVYTPPRLALQSTTNATEATTNDKQVVDINRTCRTVSLPPPLDENGNIWFIPRSEPSPVPVVQPKSRKARMEDRKAAGLSPGPATMPMVTGSRRWRAAQRRTGSHTA